MTDAPPQLSGTVADSSCKFDTLAATAKALQEDLRNLTATDFFRHWRVDLYKDCPFWQDNSLCYMRDCAVQTCDAVSLLNSTITGDIRQRLKEQKRIMCRPFARKNR